MSSGKKNLYEVLFNFANFSTLKYFHLNLNIDAGYVLRVDICVYGETRKKLSTIIFEPDNRFKQMILFKHETYWMWGKKKTSISYKI